MTESEEEKSYSISENIKTIELFLKNQPYFEKIKGVCTVDACYSVDIHDLKRSIHTIEEKTLAMIGQQAGKEKALETRLKGFSITKVLTY